MTSASRTARMRIVLLPVVTTLAVGLSGHAWSEQGRASYRYTGVVRARSAAEHTVTVETRHGLLDFIYRFPSEKQCVELKALTVGDAVQVVSPTGRAPYVASCISKVTLAGGTR